ncbi:MAG TPA: DUF4129 domain-containing protein [Vicinamibacterales bacterium]|nr:DUF4129 domain-containing protein [Vicinamibacterales bacterium]
MRLRISILLVLAALSPAAAQTPPTDPAGIDLTSFIATIDRITRSIEQASPHDVNRLLPEVPSRMRVRSDDGRDFDVPLEFVAKRLSSTRSDERRWPERRREIVAQLHDIRTEAEACRASQPPAVADGDRMILASVLARREFARHTPSTWRARLQERIRQWLRELWESMGGSQLDTRRVALGLAWLATLAALGGIALWLHRSTRTWIGTAALEIGAPEEASAPAREWALRALAALRDGQTGEAARCAYRAALQRFEELGIWRVDAARTAREYTRLLEAGDARRDPFLDIARVFERTFYAGRLIAPDEALRLTAHLETIGCLRSAERPT